MSLFDQQNLAEITHPDYPGERLITCHNPALARMRKHKRAALLDVTEEGLKTIQKAVIAGRLKDAGKTGLRVGKTLGKNNMAKHFHVTSADNTMDAAEAVRVYKSLGERGEDLQIPQIQGSAQPSDLPLHRRTDPFLRAFVDACRTPDLAPARRPETVDVDR